MVKEHSDPVSQSRLWQPPEGYAPDGFIATTMLLDVSSAVRTLLQSRFPGAARLSKEEASACLAAQAEEGKCHFFYDEQKGVLGAGGQPRSVRAVMEMCHPVRHSHVFHPKIILARFRGAKDNCYRLQVSSKNLTEASVFEVGAQFSTRPGPPNHNLPDLLRFLSEQANSAAFSEMAAEMIRDLNGMRFVAEGAEDVEITVSGINGATQSSLLKCLGGEQGGRLPAALPAGRDMVILSPDYETAQDKLEGFPVYAPAQAQTHAKLYCDLGEQTIWLGSSNLSDNGMAGNVECMARLRPAGGCFPAERTGQTARVFGVPCSRTVVSCIPGGQLQEEAALARFLREHSFSMKEARTSDGKLQVRVQVCLTGGEDIFPEILPYGMSEQTAGGNSRWKTLAAADARYIFTGSKRDFPCAGILRVRHQNTERLVRVPTAGDGSARELLEDALRGFLQRDWFRLLCREKTREQACREAARISGILLASPALRESAPLIRRHLRYIHWYAGRCARRPQPPGSDFPAPQAPALPAAPAASATPASPKFQRDAIRAVLDAFQRHGRTRYLVADETGLGKTHIARGVIEELYKAHKRRAGGLPHDFVVYYFGSNTYLLKDTLKKLVGNSRDYEHEAFSEIDRLGVVVPKLQLGEIRTFPDRINLVGVSANLLGGASSAGFSLEGSNLQRGDEKERDLYLRYLLSVAPGREESPDTRAASDKLLARLVQIREALVDTLVRRNARYVPLSMGQGDELSRQLRQCLCQVVPDIREYFVRKALAGATIQRGGRQAFVAPDLIVVDEFHRYHEILTRVLGPHQQQSGVPMLMLSATPYVMYAGDLAIDSDIAENENARADQGFKTFTDVLSFLAQGDASGPKLVEAYRGEWKKPQPDLEALSALLKGYVWRNERVGSAGNKYRDLPEEQTWLSGQYDSCIPGALDAPEPRRYFSLCPGPFSFPYRSRADEFYQDLDLAELESNGGLDPRGFLFDACGRLQKERLETFLPLRLVRDAVANPGRRLLWVPPSQPLYRVDREDIPADFTKLLVFSGYHMVPRMLSAVFSELVCPRSAGTPPKCGITRWDAMDERLLASLAQAYVPSPAQAAAPVEEILAGLAGCQAVVRCQEALGATKEYWALYAMGAPLVCGYRLTGSMEAAGRIDAAFQGYFRREEIAYVLCQAGVTDELRLLRYCVDHQLQAVLWEYRFCAGSLADLEAVLSPPEASVKVAVPNGGGWKELSLPCHFALRFSPDVGDTGASGTSRRGKENQAGIQRAFNSPFWPMMLITTSTGQEGVDLDQYCSRIMHYSLPANPMSFEQRDGRVERRRSLLARRIMVEQYGAPAGISADRFWDWLFTRGADASGMVPDWVQPSGSDRWKLERIIPYFPLSREYEMYQRLLCWKNLYRKKMGIPTEQIGPARPDRYLKLNDL